MHMFTCADFTTIAVVRVLCHGVLCRDGIIAYRSILTYANHIVVYVAEFVGLRCEFVGVNEFQRYIFIFNY